jgi:hypothetical protein
LAGEPWFQDRAKIEEKYELADEEVKTFAFHRVP